MNGHAYGRTLARCAFALALVAPAWAQPKAGAIQIYFPPPPPILGKARGQPNPAGGNQAPAPGELGPYLYAPFYAPLSTRLAKHEVDDALLFRIESYRSARTALLAELHAQLDTLKEATPQKRVETLAAFARDQTPRIIELEKTAERLRADLSTTGSSWKEYVRWRIGIFTLPAPTPAERPLLRRQFLEAAVYYERGLSPDQRRLLLERVQEADDRAASSPPPADRPEVLAFSPASARIVLPSNLPTDLALQVTAYRAAKAALVSELEATLFGRDKDAESPEQVEALGGLAQAQAPQFAALENVAEAIRRGLAILQDPFQPPALSAVPADLATRVAAYRTAKVSLQKALLARVEDVKRTRGANAAGSAETIQQAITAFTKENADRYAALTREHDSIRTDLAKLPGASAGSGSSPDALLTKFSQSLRDLERAWDYRDYKTAALQPGLSPAQRRLLFGGALEKLSLPLPDATLRFGQL